MGMRQFYELMSAPPEEWLLTATNLIAREIGICGLDYAITEETRRHFSIRRLRGPGGQGLVLYHIYPKSAGVYIESM